MIYLTTFDELKRHTEERRNRALAKYESSRRHVNDSYFRPRPDVEADVVEVTFGSACAPQSIGA